MIARHYDAPSLMETMGPYEDELEGFHPEGWLANEENVCLTDGAGNFTLFERSLPGTVTGHYFLRARGREALDLCKEFLREIFEGPYGVEQIVGLTPLNKRGALWMNRQLGFKPEGVVDTTAGPAQMVVLTKAEWSK